MPSLDFPRGRWRARWIWHDAPPIEAGSPAGPSLDRDAADRFVLLRRTFTLDEVPATAPVRATADSRYVLHVNGAELMRGPVRSDPRDLRYDVADAARMLRRGENVLAVVARYYGRPTAWWVPAPVTFSLGGGAFVCEVRCGDEWIVSDAAWRCVDASGWRAAPAGGISAARPEIVDARRLPAGWTSPGFDDAGWSPALELDVAHVGSTGVHEPPSDPYGALRPRPIAQLTGNVRAARAVAVAAIGSHASYDDPVRQVEADEVEAVADGPHPRAGAAQAATSAGFPIAVEDSAVVTVDFGEVVAGTAVLRVDAPAGTRVDVSAAEGLYPDGRLRRLHQRAGFTYLTRGHDDAFETFDPIGLRFAKLSVRGPATVEAFEVRERLYPRPDGPSFTCSDPLLDRVYAIGLRTVDLNAQDAYLDCPTREQRAWTGDSVVHQQVHLATNPDWRLARWHPRLAACPRPDGMLPMAAACDFAARDAAYIPDWALHWVRSVHNLLRYTGDVEAVASLLPVAEGVLRWFVPFLDGGLLRDVTGWVLIDWASVYSAHTSGALNALWARALRDFAEMAAWLGDAGRERWARRLHEGVAEAFDAFWDDARGVYVDQITSDGPQPMVSQHTNAAAVAAGLVPEARVDGVLDRVTDPVVLLRHSWYMQALEREDLAGMRVLVTGYPVPDWDTATRVVAAEPFFRYVVHDALASAGRAGEVAEACRDWKVFVDAGETTWPETWHGGTHCHGWSSTPTRDLVVYTLGIRPAEPGFAKALVAPRLGDLAWAEGAAPTPHGLVTVRAEPDELRIDSPVPVVVDVPWERADLPAGSHVLRA